MTIRKKKVKYVPQLYRKMIDRLIIHEALKSSLTPEIRPGQKIDKLAFLQGKYISMLVHDIFGGEILKTHLNRKWHFYNRIDGERIDFALPEKANSDATIKFEDIPASPEETLNIIEQEDYSTFFVRFIRAFEETVGLDRNIKGLAT